MKIAIIDESLKKIIKLIWDVNNSTQGYYYVIIIQIQIVGGAVEVEVVIVL